DSCSSDSIDRRGGVPKPRSTGFRSVKRRTLVLSGSSTLFFFQAEDGIRDATVTGVQTCALPISFRTYEKSTMKRTWTLLLVALLSLAYRPARADEPPYLDFVRSLREKRRAPDLALEYLQDLRDRKSVV